ncbi:MAG: XRE family transcriptional regulator [Candidatus Rokuibacteriota bacterium]
MGKPIHVPITPQVLDWAIKESGYTVDEVAIGAHISRDDLRAWLRDDAKPTLTQARSLAKVLKRTLSTFLLPDAPPLSKLPAEFRHAPGSLRTKANFDERLHLRRARRIQEAAKWLSHELGESQAPLRKYSTHDDVEEVGQYTRQRLGPLLPTPLESWRTHSQAFRAWRAALEKSGVLVLVLPLGEDAARGFSLWDDSVPLIAVNSAWNWAARVYTLFHELGHLLTRTSSVCLERSTGPKLSRPTDPEERWCEEFAAAALLPWSGSTGVAEFLKKRFEWSPGEKVATLDVPRAIANVFKVSWRAATIRLIDRDLANWALYGAIPPYIDRKKRGGGGGGRDRGDIVYDELGEKTLALFFHGLNRHVIGRDDLFDYLDVSDAALDRLQVAVRN